MAAFLYDMSEVLACLMFIAVLFGVATFVLVTGVALHEVARSGISWIKLKVLSPSRRRAGRFRTHARTV